MSESRAWSLVVGQFALLAALLLVPQGDLWPRSGALWVVVGALWAISAGMGIWAGVTLGSNLTPNPIPRPEGTLETSGPYRYVRHPIYTAVLALALGLFALGASWWHLVIFCALVMLLAIKARVEERLLLERFETYRDYQAQTGRFLPGVGRKPR
jgi:protein-S-isoprenylcysteine O-methyltransferase Ste14